jgi:Cu/Ag efflux pump CusA
MIGAIVRNALRFRGLMVGIAAGIIVLGVVSLKSAPVDVYPEFTPPYVEIQTESLGLSAPEVEQLLTVPLEADLLNGIEGVDVIRSKSLPGLSSITLVFEPGFDLYKGRALVQERLVQLGGAAFPNVSDPPTMLQPLSSSSRVLMIGLDSDKLGPIERSVIAKWTVKPRLSGVQGVANVSIWGLRDQQMQVQVDPQKLADRNVSLKQVISTAGNAQIASPVSYLEAAVPGTGGFIETPSQRLPVRNVFENIYTPEALARLPVEETGGRVRLSDVTKVTTDHPPLIGDAVVNDGDGLVLMIEKFPGTDVKEVTKGVEDALNDLKPGLAGMTTDTSIYRPASFIDKATDNITLALIIGAVLLAGALVAFLLAWRTVLIALITVPVSMVAAALALDFAGETFNAISFAGLALGLLIIVDEAVVGSENIARRLRERKAGDASLATVVQQATQEVRGPLGYATVIALLAIVPLAIMEGRPGAFLAPLAVAYALAVVVGMVVALTITPALAYLLPDRGGVSPLVTGLGKAYDGMLSAALAAKGAVLGGAAVTVVAVVALIAVLNPSDPKIVPDLKDTGVLVRLDADPGTSNAETTKIATDLSKQIRGIDGVENVAAHVGRAITGDRIVDVNSSEVLVALDPDADFDKAFASIEDAAGGIQGAKTEVITASAQRIREVGAVNEGENVVTGEGLDVLTGSDKPLVVRVYGQEFGVLKQQAEKVLAAVREVDGVKNPTIRQVPTQQQLQIEVDVTKARDLGLKPGDIRRAEAVMVQGILVGNTFEDQKVFDVIVQGTPTLRRSIEALRNLRIDLPDGGTTRLADVADIRETPVETIIERDAVSRKIDIVADADGNLGNIADSIKERLEGVAMPQEYHAEVFEHTVADEINSGQIIAFIGAALIAIMLLFQAAFRSWKVAATAFLTLPVALAGGVVGALLLGGDMTIGVMAGLIALLVLAARNGVTLVRHFQERERGHGDAFGPEGFGPELVRRGAQERFAATVTSAVAIAAVLVPFVVLGGGAGLEILSEMGLVVLIGLISLLALSLFVLPALYLRFAAGETPAADTDEDHLPAFVSDDDSDLAVVR